MTNKRTLSEMVKQVEIEGGSQIYTIGSPGESIEVRFEKGDSEILISADDGSEQTRVWLDRKNALDLHEALSKALESIK